MWQKCWMSVKRGYKMNVILPWIVQCGQSLQPAMNHGTFSETRAWNVSRNLLTASAGTQSLGWRTISPKIVSKTYRTTMQQVYLGIFLIYLVPISACAFHYHKNHRQPPATPPRTTADPTTATSTESYLNFQASTNRNISFWRQSKAPHHHLGFQILLVWHSSFS